MSQPIVSLSEPLKEALLSVTNELPPSEFLAYCDTPDQKFHWLEIKQAYGFLHEALKDYFEGRAANHGHLNKKERELYAAFRDYYLTYYNVIQWGWCYIEEYAVKHDSVVPDRNPGEALLRTIEDEATFAFSACLSPYRRWTPYQVRKLAKSDRELKAAIDSGKPLSAVQERKLASYNREVDQIRQPYGNFLARRQAFIHACEEQGKQDEQLSHLLKEYKRAKSRLDALVQSQLHPSKRRRGTEWKHGVKRQL